MGHGEWPVLGIIRSSIGDKIGLIGKRVEMRLEFAQRNPLSHWGAIAHDMQIRVSKVDDLFTLFVLNVRIPNIPLARDRPIEDCRSRRHLMHVQWNVRTNFAQRLSHPISCDAPANGKYLGGKRKNFLAEVLRQELPPKTARNIHEVA